MVWFFCGGGGYVLEGKKNKEKRGEKKKQRLPTASGVPILCITLRSIFDFHRRSPNFATQTGAVEPLQGVRDCAVRWLHWRVCVGRHEPPGTGTAAQRPRPRLFLLPQVRLVLRENLDFESGAEGGTKA